MWPCVLGPGASSSPAAPAGGGHGVIPCQGCAHVGLGGSWPPLWAALVALPHGGEGRRGAALRPVPGLHRRPRF